jgi:hypothetical protein
MDAHQFDHLARKLAGVATRRGPLRGIVIASAPGVGPGLHATGAKNLKRQICRQIGSATNQWQVSEISASAYSAQLRHGDAPFVDCCSMTECGEGQERLTGVCTTPSCKYPVETRRPARAIPSTARAL